MKKILSLFIFTCIITMTWAQSETELKVDSLIKVGIQYHEDGAYEKAVSAYQAALKLDPQSSILNYEIAYSYMYMEEYEKSLKHANMVIANDGVAKQRAYNIKGSCLDYLGRTEEANKVLLRAIEEFGEDYLIYYNLALNYFKLKEYDAAEQYLIKGINNNSTHASSHLLLTYVMVVKDQIVPAILSLEYFLFLEPQSKRSQEAYSLLISMMQFNVEQKDDKKIDIFISDKKSDFSTVVTALSMYEASKYTEEYKNQSELELFISKNGAMFTILENLSKEQKKSDLWWDFYVPFYVKTAQSGHAKTFSHMIGISSEKASREWLLNNKEETNTYLDLITEE